MTMNDSIIAQGEAVVSSLGRMLLYDSQAPMLFSSGLFWLLFIFFLPVFVLLRGSRNKMVLFVICFSLYFYYKSSGLFFLMLMATSLCDWGDGQGQEAGGAPGPDVDVGWVVAFDSWIFQICQFFPLELEPDGGGQFPAA